MNENLILKPQEERKNSEIRLGEFIAALEVVPHSKLSAALKVSQDLGLPIGRTLVVRGLISNEDLSSLLELHGMFKRSAVDFHNVSEAYAISKRRGWHVKEALSALGCAVDEIETVRLGELLIDAELIAQDGLEDALGLQALCGLPLGRVLSIDSRVPEKIVSSALTYQNSIRDQSMRYEDAVDKLKMMPFMLQSESMRPIIPLTLKDLLIGGRVCDEGDLLPALNFASANNLPIEKVLLSYDWVETKLISASVALTGMIEKGYITAQDAMEFLTTVREGERLKQIKANLNRSPELRIIEGDLNLYKFLIAAGFLTPDRIRELTKTMVNHEADFGHLIGKELDRNSSRSDVRAAIFECFATDHMLVRVLIKFGKVDEVLVDHSQHLVDLVVIGGATIEQALLSFAWKRKELGL